MNNNDYKYEVYEFGDETQKSECIAKFRFKDDALLFSNIVRYIAFSEGNPLDYFVKQLKVK